MSLPTNITKTHLLNAINRIDTEGIKSGEDSRYYDVLYNNKRYPPKLVISFANLYANGQELDRNLFNGGQETECFSLLRNNGFIIVKKEGINQPKIWIEKTIVEGRQDRIQGERALGKALWTPQKAKDGSDIYKNMRLVREGDIILHLINNEAIVGVSKVANSFIQTTGLAGTPWPDPAYLIKLKDYTALKQPLNRSDFLITKYESELKAIEQKSEVFYNNILQLRQGAYLTPCIPSLAFLLNNIYHTKTNEWLPFLEAGEEMNSPQKEVQPAIQETNKKTQMYSLNTILYGPPGTGKTYNTINTALSILGENIEGSNRSEIKKTYDTKVKEGRIVFTTFHQSMSYEDFVEGIKPLKPVPNEPLRYNIQDGLFKLLCTEAKKTSIDTITVDSKEQELDRELFKSLYYEYSSILPNVSNAESSVKFKTKEGNEFGLFKNRNDSIVVKAGAMQTPMSISYNELAGVFFDSRTPLYKSYEQIIIDNILNDKNYHRYKADNIIKPFVLIIDEINRGNVSEIFGELITLIEDDKRLGNREAIEVMLPYSKERFGVPANLYILGTMNTADRSVEALDTALRRRFSFKEMLPNSTLLEKIEIEGINLKQLLDTINKRIEKLLDRDHLIGHAYFIGLEKIEDLINAFYNKMIPLLQEYFFGDYGKIGLVLGKGFIREKIVENTDELFASFDYDTNGIEEKKVYEIIDYKDHESYELNIDDKQRVKVDFTKAISLLLNK